MRTARWDGSHEAVNAMLLNEFLKNQRVAQDQARKLQEQETTIAQLESTVTQQRKDFETTIAQQQNEIKALRAGLEKVSAQLEINKALQLLANSQ
jgi:Rps23 Pro-64 3,4-dihydroxylase Tpa1-like proline 4-hydroxylase